MTNKQTNLFYVLNLQNPRLRIASRRFQSQYVGYKLHGLISRDDN